MNTDLLPERGLILCAVSGGVDSMYLLCRLEELGFSVAAAHYNHGLRPGESDRDEDFVRGFCQARGIPFIAGRGDVAAEAAAAGEGVEEAARRMRYAFLERAASELGAAVIATAHTAEDNAETVLMHLIRGSGLRGLGGIPPVRGRIVRPMLGVTRREAERYLAERGIPHVEDSTNAGDDYLRNRLRHRVVPLLTEENPAFAETVSRTAELLRQDEAYLESLALDFVRSRGADGTLPAEELAALPLPVAARVVRLMAGAGIGGQHVDAILRTAERGGAADVSGMRVARSGSRLYFGVTEKPSLPDRILTPGQPLLLPEAEAEAVSGYLPVCPPDVYKSLNIFYFKCANIYGNITITARKPGDRFCPAGRKGSRTMKAVFEELGVPPWERGRVPVIRDEAGILAVCGAGTAERAAARPGDEDIIKIEILRRKEPEAGG